VQRLEKGKRGAGAKTLARLALALGTTSEYLLGVTDDDREIFMLTGESRDEKRLGVVLPAKSVDWGP
jgi:transcriptional regulator with XRE-family HTH domain